MIRVETIPELQLGPTDERQIAALLTRAFGPDFDGRSYYRQRHHLRLVVRDADSIVGHAALLMRDIRLGDRLVTIVGLAEVSTGPDHRGHGIATAILTEAIAQANRSIAKFVVLFGDRPIYAGLGFMRANNALTYTVLDDARTHSIKTRVDEGLMILPIGGAKWNFSAKVDLLGHLF